MCRYKKEILDGAITRIESIERILYTSNGELKLLSMINNLRDEIEKIKIKEEENARSLEDMFNGMKNATSFWANSTSVRRIDEIEEKLNLLILKSDLPQSGMNMSTHIYIALISVVVYCVSKGILFILFGISL